jgi:hypothetical protein
MERGRRGYASLTVESFPLVGKDSFLGRFTGNGVTQKNQKARLHGFSGRFFDGINTVGNGKLR